MPESKKRVFRAGPEGTRVEDEGTQHDPDLTERTLQEMSFSTHIISLNTLGLMQLGHLGDGPVDRDGARHVIDTLEVLREKTAGNLTREESKLLDTLLYDLRMKFLELP